LVEKLIRRLRRDEGGMTLIELLIAAAVMAVGVLALMGTFDGSRQLVGTSEKNDVAAHQGETELERIIAMGYRNVALTAAPSHSASQTNPDFYVNGGTYQWDQSAAPQPVENLWIDPASGLIAHTSTWNDGQSRLSGSLYDYVTLVPDPNATDPNNADARKHPAKRVTVAVTVNNNGAGGLKKPVLVSAIVIDPHGG
jgi:prepilin-type N-terminal cleavage/methylation domain-containing protein